MKTKRLFITMMSIVSINSFAGTIERPSPGHTFERPCPIEVGSDSNSESASSRAKWEGVARIIPGDNMTITGKDGSLTVINGEIELAADGTFSASVPVILESHEYSDNDGDGVKDVGDLYDTNWSLDPATPLTVTWGSNITEGIEAKVIDLNTGIELTTSSGPEQVSFVSLGVSNEKAVTNPVTNPQAELLVNATVISSVI